MKKRIRITESELHNIVKKCVNETLNERDYMSDGDLEPQYDNSQDPMYTWGGNGNKMDDNEESWDYFDAVRNDADMKMKDRLNVAARDRGLTNYPRSVNPKAYTRDGYNYETGEFDPPYTDFKNRLDKMWNDTKEKEKYSKQADSRPLHRKGSLNRVLNEGKLKKDFKKDTVQGKYLRYTPEDSGFDSQGKWNFGKNYNEDEMFSLVDESITSLEKARTYARENGNGKIYMLLNEIIGELVDVISKQS